MTWWHYLLLCNLYLILFFGFYRLLLQRETFFQLNRIYLVGSAILSFLIPAIQLDGVRQWFITQKVHQTLYSANPDFVYRFQAIQPDRVTLGEVVGFIYAGGILVLSVKLIWQLIVLSRLLKSKQAMAAWSFFKKIKVDEQMDHRDVIIAHEEVHARQWHSADVLLMEVIMIINWFNPVVYLYRRSVKHIHEFIADQNALKSGTSKADYAMLLLNQTFNAPVHHLLNPFFSSSILKQRIIMLQKSKSRYSALLKYGFSAPLFALMLALSSATLSSSNVVEVLHKEANKIFESTAPVPFETSVATPLVKADVETPATKTEVLSLKANGINVQAQPLKTTAETLMPMNGIQASTHNEVFTSVEKLPSFPGGMESFGRYLGKSLQYPQEARQHGTEGRVNITFVVEADGSLTGVRSLRDPGYGLGEEAVRVISASPKWTPGEQNGNKVAVQYTVPVVFTLTEQGQNQANNTADAPASVKNIFFMANSSYTDTSKVTAGMSKPKVTSITLVSRSGKTNIPIKNPLIMINGKEKPAGTSLDDMDVNSIEKIMVYKDEAATNLYGDKGKNSVISIITKLKP